MGIMMEVYYAVKDATWFKKTGWRQLYVHRYILTEHFGMAVTQPINLYVYIIVQLGIYPVQYLHLRVLYHLCIYCVIKAVLW